MNLNRVVRHVLVKMYRYTETCTHDERLFGKCSHCGIRMHCNSMRDIEMVDKETNKVGFERAANVFVNCLSKHPEYACESCPISSDVVDKDVCYKIDDLWGVVSREIREKPSWRSGWGCARDCEICEDRFICLTSRDL